MAVLVPDGGRLEAAADGVVAAVRQALADVSIRGWTVEVERVPDGSSAEGSDGGPDGAIAEVARRLADGPEVIAVVGGLSSPVVRAAQPVLDEAGIPFVSPADGEPEHTRGADPAIPRRPYESYFRAAVPESDPQETAAEYAVVGLGADRVAVMTDGTPGTAVAFERRVRRLGAEVVADANGSEEAPVRYVTDGPHVAAEVAAGEPDAVVIGGPALLTDEYLAAAGPAAAGTVAVAPASLEPSAGRAVPGLDEPGEFGAAAYDAGTALAGMLERCLPSVRSGSASEARVGCLAELARAGFDGATGEFSFDRYGDRPGAFPQVFVVEDSAWTEVGDP
ncbi:MAG: ABC transporter substrate-binding protein [Jiangellaceae bacterium]